ncbi:MAG: M60 family peptidase N-terminal accessory domain-containing protein [Bacteroides sp.]|nr:M60 family peptidase N-terminal accessory domain-containing protein [Bacteroides sp.]
MNKNLLYTAFAIFVVATSLGSCIDVEYTYEAENGFDDRSQDSASVTVDTLQGIDVSMYEQARIFPGLVDTLTEMRIDTIVTFDLSKTYVDNSSAAFAQIYGSDGRIESLPQPIYSTGVFAGAGELVTIVVPDGTWGLTVQVGMQTDNLGDGGAYSREPIVYTRKTLYPGSNRVRFPLGGYVWIIREPDVTGSEVCQLEFRNVYAAPDFIMDVTDPDGWKQQVQNTTVPWLDIRSKYVAMSVDRTRMENYITIDSDFADNLNEVLHTWDYFMEYYYAVSGHTPDNEKVADCMPPFQQRFVFDVQLVDNYVMHNLNEQGVMMMKNTAFYDDLLELTTVKYGESENIYLALLDRLTANYVPYSSDWTTAFQKIPIFRLVEQTGCLSDREDFLMNFEAALSYASADSSKTLSIDRWVNSGDYDDYDGFDEDILRLLVMTQIGKIGLDIGNEEWEFHIDVSEASRAAYRTTKTDTYYFRALCDYYKINFTPLYDHWGITLDDADREYASNYELPPREYWKINPANTSDVFANVDDYNKSSFRYRHNRSSWEIWATENSYRYENDDTEYTSESSFHTASLLLDGDITTYWHSYLDEKDRDNQQDSPYELPYYILIDMQEAQTVDGVYFGNGRNIRYVSGITVQYTSNTSDMSLDETSVEWIDVLSMRQTRTTGLNNVVFYDFDQTISARYLRIVITDANLLTYDENDEDAAVAFETYHKNRRQSFSEFGTYYYK